MPKELEEKLGKKSWAQNVIEAITGFDEWCLKSKERFLAANQKSNANTNETGNHTGATEAHS